MAKEYLITASVLVVVGSFMTLLVCRSCAESLSKFVYLSTFFSVMWIALWLGNSFFSDWVSEKVSWTQQPLKMFFIILIFTVAYTSLAVYLIVLFYENVLEFRIQSDGIFYSSLIITFLISLFMHGRSFLLSWKQSAIDAERLKHESVTARYESLKNQVNPHFLFNSLNALTNLVYEDKEKAVKFIKQLSEVYRYVLDTRDKEVVPLQEELRFLESYGYLQKIRFGDKLKIEHNLNGAQTQIAPLALQMLIENAIKHNIVSEDEPLLISIYEEDDYIVVENNLQRKGTIGELSAGVGLENIGKRYEFLSNKKVMIAEDDKHFVVKLPVLR